MELRRGNTYSLDFRLGNVDVDEVDKIEFTIGNVQRIYPTDVRYEDGKFICELTQEETFSFKANLLVPIQARVKFVDGTVTGSEIIKCKVNVVLSEVVL